MKAIKKPSRFYIVHKNVGGFIYTCTYRKHRKYTSAYGVAVKVMKKDPNALSCIISSNYGAAINITRTLLKRLNKIK